MLAGLHTLVQVRPPQDRVGDLHHVGEGGNEAAHAHAAIGTDVHPFDEVLRAVPRLQFVADRLEDGSYASHGIVHLVRDQPDHFFVRLLFGFHHLVGQAFYQNKRMGKASIQKRQRGTTINQGVAQADGTGMVPTDPLDLPGQRRGYLRQGLACELLERSCSEKTQRRLVRQGDMPVEVFDDHAHGRGIDQQVQKPMLFRDP